MTKHESIFESKFGIMMPESLAALSTIKAPVGFRFADKPFVLEIQYFLDLEDQENYDSDARLLAIAVNSDGYVVLVNVDSLEILQNEGNGADELGLTVGDLLQAEIY